MEGGLAISENIYILYCVTHKTEQVQRVLRRQGFVSYILRMEKYFIRELKEQAVYALTEEEKALNVNPSTNKAHISDLTGLQ